MTEYYPLMKLSRDERAYFFWFVQLFDIYCVILNFLFVFYLDLCPQGYLVSFIEQQLLPVFKKLKTNDYGTD